MKEKETITAETCGSFFMNEQQHLHRQLFQIANKTEL